MLQPARPLCRAQGPSRLQGTGVTLRLAHISSTPITKPSCCSKLAACGCIQTVFCKTGLELLSFENTSCNLSGMQLCVSQSHWQMMDCWCRPMLTSNDDLHLLSQNLLTDSSGMHTGSGIAEQPAPPLPSATSGLPQQWHADQMTSMLGGSTLEWNPA